MSTPGAAPSQSPLVPPGFGGVPLPAGIPATVQRAFLIWLGIVAVNVVGNLLTAFGTYGSIVSFVFALIGGAVGVYLALQFRGGRNWARIVLTVFTGLAMLFGLFGLIGSFVLIAFAPLTGFVTLVICAVAIVGGALALLAAWNRDSNEFFNRMPS